MKTAHQNQSSSHRRRNDILDRASDLGRSPRNQAAHVCAYRSSIVSRSRFGDRAAELHVLPRALSGRSRCRRRPSGRSYAAVTAPISARPRGRRARSSHAHTRINSRRFRSDRRDQPLRLAPIVSARAISLSSLGNRPLGDPSENVERNPCAVRSPVPYAAGHQRRHVGNRGLPRGSAGTGMASAGDCRSGARTAKAGSLSGTDARDRLSSARPAPSTFRGEVDLAPAR